MDEQTMMEKLERPRETTKTIEVQATSGASRTTENRKWERTTM